jgi:hypothetical protein
MGRTWYFSATGRNTADGMSPATARKDSLTGLGIIGGDTLRFLSGTFTTVPMFASTLSGSQACPILITGSEDGGTTMQAPFTVDGSYLVIRHFYFNVLNANSVWFRANSHNVTVQFNTFDGQPSTGYPIHVFLNSCISCAVRENVFLDIDNFQVLESDVSSTATMFFGNTVHAHANASGVDMSAANCVIASNDFTGAYATPDNGYIDVTGSTNCRVERNVFHDLTGVDPNQTFIAGAARVANNTIVNVTNNVDAPFVGPVGAFEDNLVIGADWVSNANTPRDGGYNIFDPSVTRPYADYDGGSLSGTDRIAAVSFDPGTYVPTASSAAIDSADPTIAVPPGGGNRADVGAIERGAQRLADGRYCVLDGGF